MLSTAWYGPLVPNIQELNGAKVAKAFLNPSSVVKGLNIFGYGLPGRFPGRIEAPVDDFLYMNRKGAFAPGDVARFSGCGKALLPAASRYLLLYLGRSALASAVAVKDHARGRTPTILSGLRCLQDGFLFHILRLAEVQNGIAQYIADLAKILHLPALLLYMPEYTRFL